MQTEAPLTLLHMLSFIQDITTFTMGTTVTMQKDIMELLPGMEGLQR